VAMVALTGSLGVKSLAAGVVIGGGLIVALQLGPLWRAGALPRPNLGFRHPAVRNVLALYVPIALGLLVNTAAVVVDRNLAWGAGENALGAMRYATTLTQLVLGLVAAAISLAALPTLSRHHAAGDEDAFRATLGRALAMVTVLIVPATLGLAAVGKPAVELLFHHGATTAAGAHAILVALLGYLPGTLCAAYDQVLIFAFYARRNTRTPVLVGVAAVGVYLAIALSLVQPFGMLGLVFANSAQWVAHAIIMYLLARRAFDFAAGPALRRVVATSAGAAAGMALLVLALWLGLAASWPAPAATLPQLARELALVALPVGAGASFYLAALHLLGVEEIAALRRALLGRFLPRLAG